MEEKILTIDWESIDIGIKALTMLLLLGAAILNFLKRKKQNSILAFLCLLFSIWCLWKICIYYRFAMDVFLPFYYSIREAFIPVLVYLFIYSLKNNIEFKKTSSHLIAPTIVLLGTMGLGLYGKYSGVSLRFYTAVLSGPSITILTIIYFLKTKKELKKLKLKLIKKAYFKYSVFAYSILLLAFLWGSMSTIHFFLIYDYLLANFPEQMEYYGSGSIYCCADTGNTFINMVINFVTGPYTIIITLSIVYHYIALIMLFLFALSELNYIKNIFLPKQILYDGKANEDNFIAKVENYFNDQNNFTNKNLTINTVTKKIGCTKKELIDYLHLHKELTFNNYINQLRIDYFKQLIVDKNNEIYDTLSLSLMVGFKSKATFYRVFKQHEGLTPVQYKNKMKC